MGIAPDANLIALKISDENGMASESDSVAALQWVLDNRATFNIRVVNLSINSATPQSYNTSPLDAAAEILWFNGIVVIASAGNAEPPRSILRQQMILSSSPWVRRMKGNNAS